MLDPGQSLNAGLAVDQDGLVIATTGEPQGKNMRNGVMTDADGRLLLSPASDLPSGAVPTFQPGGTAFAVPGGAWHNVDIGGGVGGAKNETGFSIYLVIRAGVAANGDQNGHIYLDLAPDNNGGALPVAGWVTADYVAFRNNQAAVTGDPAPNAGGKLGAGRGLACFLPPNAWYRLRPFVVPGYSAPEWILDGATPGFFQTIT